jgi:hypothetical protein
VEHAQIPFNASPAAYSPSDVLAGGPGEKARWAGCGVLCGSKPLLYAYRAMTDDESRAKDYREQAALLRRAAKKMDSVEGCQLFLHIADEFDELADSMERARLN